MLDNPIWRERFTFAIRELMHTCRLPAKVTSLETEAPALVLRFTADESGLLPHVPRPAWMIQVALIGSRCSVLVSRDDGAAEASVPVDGDCASNFAMMVWDGALHSALAMVRATHTFVGVSP